MFPSIKRTINFEVVKTPPGETAEPKKTLTEEELLHRNAMVIANVERLGRGVILMYAAKKAIDTASQVIIKMTPVA